MQISHVEAHKLIQRSLDGTLLQEEISALVAHLQTCPECSTYRDEIRDVEDTLRLTMSKHWNLPPAPLDMNAITGSRLNLQDRLVIQLAMVSLVILLIAFGAWRFVNINIFPTKTIQISPIPTPSTQKTSTLAQNCSEIVYTVQKGETLESIAGLFSTSPEAIMELNNLPSNTIQAENKIRVPTCLTPASTARPVTFTVTFSPALMTALAP